MFKASMMRELYFSFQLLSAHQSQRYFICNILYQIALFSFPILHFSGVCRFLIFENEFQIAVSKLLIISTNAFTVHFANLYLLLKLVFRILYSMSFLCIVCGLYCIFNLLEHSIFHPHLSFPFSLILRLYF